MAEKMKFIIQTSGAKYKEQSGALSTATLDIASNAITYRVFGREQQRRDAYEESLTAYEKSAVKANIWNTSLTSVYRVISMAGCNIYTVFRWQKCTWHRLECMEHSNIYNICIVLYKAFGKVFKCSKTF